MSIVKRFSCSTRCLTIMFVLLCTCVLIGCACAEQEGLYTYQINDDNTVTITGFDWKNNHGDIYIPEMLGNRMISTIGDQSFATTGNDPVSITLPDSIKSIGELAFNGVAIKYINIPTGTLSIGDGAFCQCSVMQFRVADGHQVFATIDNALYNKQEKKLIAWPTNKEISPIPEGIVSIGGYVFVSRYIWENSTPSQYFFPKSLTKIGDYAFYGSDFTGNLRNVRVIGDYAFAKGWKGSKEDLTLWADSQKGKKGFHFTDIGAHAFENRKMYFGGNDFDSDRTFTIGEYAFYNTTIRSHERFELGNVTSIGRYAFADFTYDGVFDSSILNLSSLAKLKEIGEYAFYNCRIESGKKYYESFEMYMNLETISTSSFEITGEDAWIAGGINVTIGPSTVTIGERAFAGRSYIKSITLNEGLQTIGREAFKGCTALTEIWIPATVSFIDDDVFANCSYKLIITVEAGSYGEVWARTRGYSYKINGKEEDTSWLDD